MDALQIISTLLPLSLTAGINLYATVLVVGLSIRFGWVQGTPEGLDVLASWPVIIIAGVFYLVEFLADKIPFVDNVWDVVHTFIRPLGAAMLAIALLGKAHPLVVVLGMLLAGGIALVSHGGKASTRLAVNVASPAENVTNIGLSLAEDVGVGTLAFLALKYPYVALGVGAVLLVLLLLLVPRMLRWALFTLKAVGARLKGWAHPASQSDALPVAHEVLLGHRVPELAARCRAQGVRGANGRSGYLSLLGNELAFTYSRLFGSRAWRVSRDRIVASYLRRRVLMDVLQVHYAEAGRERVARFVFMKDRTPLLERLVALLGARAG